MTERGFQVLEKPASPYGNVAVGFIMIFCTVEGFAGSCLGRNTSPALVSVKQNLSLVTIFMFRSQCDDTWSLWYT